MNYLTQYYKNRCEQLQEQINRLQKVLNESPSAGSYMDPFGMIHGGPARTAPSAPKPNPEMFPELPSGEGDIFQGSRSAPRSTSTRTPAPRTPTPRTTAPRGPSPAEGTAAEGAAAEGAAAEAAASGDAALAKTLEGLNARMPISGRVAKAAGQTALVAATARLAGEVGARQNVGSEIPAQMKSGYNQAERPWTPMTPDSPEFARMFTDTLPLTPTSSTLRKPEGFRPVDSSAFPGQEVHMDPGTGQRFRRDASGEWHGSDVGMGGEDASAPSEKTRAATERLQADARTAKENLAQLQARTAKEREDKAKKGTAQSWADWMSGKVSDVASAIEDTVGGVWGLGHQGYQEDKEDKDTASVARTQRAMQQAQKRR